MALRNFRYPNAYRIVREGLRDQKRDFRCPLVTCKGALIFYTFGAEGDFQAGIIKGFTSDTSIVAVHPWGRPSAVCIPQRQKRSLRQYRRSRRTTRPLCVGICRPFKGMKLISAEAANGYAGTFAAITIDCYARDSLQCLCEAGIRKSLISSQCWRLTTGVSLGVIAP